MVMQRFIVKNGCLAAICAILLTFPVALSAKPNGLALGWCKPGNPHYDPVTCGGSMGAATGGSSAGSSGGTTVGIGNPPASNSQTVVLKPLPQQSISGFGAVTVLQSFQAPDVTGYSPGFIVQPLPPQSFAGVSPGQIQQLQAPSYSGFSPAIQVKPMVAPSFSGYSPVLTVTPVKAPPVVGYNPVVVAHPLAAPTFKGYSPVVTVVPIQSPSFTGYSPVITVHPVVSLTVTGISPSVPVKPMTAPSFTGHGPTNLVPPDPNAVHSVNVTLAPVSVQRPRPKPIKSMTAGNPKKITHSAISQGSSNRMHITPTGGRHDGNVTHTKVDSNGSSLACLTSGHGPRTNTRVGGANVAVMRNATRIDSLARDIPARHPRQSHCLVSIKRVRN